MMPIPSTTASQFRRPPKMVCTQLGSRRRLVRNGCRSYFSLWPWSCWACCAVSSPNVDTDDHKDCDTPNSDPNTQSDFGS
jgi:hypothetical protein